MTRLLMLINKFCHFNYILPEDQNTQSNRGTELVGRNRPVVARGWGVVNSHMADSVQWTPNPPNMEGAGTPVTMTG